MTQDTRDLIDEYVKGVAFGNKRALEDLYKLVQPILMVVLIRRYKNREDIEEIIQEVFRTIAEKAKYLVFFKNTFKWIIKIAENKLRNLFKMEAKQKEIMKSMPMATHSVFNESNAHIIIEIKKLPTTTQQYLVLYKYFCKMKIDEIESMTNLSRATIYRELKIALDILKEKLK